MRPLTELEGVCLALIRRLQPCTAYAVRAALKDSPSSFWRASAGSVYPLMSRFEQAGLVRSEDDPGDGRGRRRLRISGKGDEHLQEWLLAGAEPDRIAAVMDPVRSRMFAFDALDKAQQTALLDEMIGQMRRHLGEALDYARRLAADDVFGHIGAEGAIKLTRARLDWLEAARARLSDE